ncbi:hypothetical protein D9M72_453120 [compost metagenome]
MPQPGGQCGADDGPDAGTPHDQAQPKGPQSEFIQNHGRQDRPEDGGTDEPYVGTPRQGRKMGMAINPPQALRDLLMKALFASNWRPVEWPFQGK